MRALMLVTANVMMNKTANKTTIVGAGALSIKRTTRHQSLTLLPICQSPVGAQYESVVSGVPQWRQRNEQRNGENDTYRFQRRHNGQRDHAQQPIMQPSSLFRILCKCLFSEVTVRRSPNSIIKRLIAIRQSFNGIVHFWDADWIASHTTFFHRVVCREHFTLFDRMADHAV